MSDAQIASALHVFYQDLYSVQRDDPGPSLHYLEQACTAKLTPEEAAPLEAPIRKALYPSLAPILTRLFNNIRGLEDLLSSMLDVAIVVIPKP
ncbi:hypothetical protein NDU88_002158 [Pleurodeles waltl]|uniref:Uncharacterized protein n=1 Tax=Pleurodeles waltl TaxID=8319 RepID=A0AAV7VZV1_PLEWA|nr:hypothetical protein NDU88_002158 [Pleurodeles waltl]